MAKARLHGHRRQQILTFLAQYEGEWGVDDLAEHFKVAYQTAHEWKRQLEHEQMVTRTSTPGRRVQYMITEGGIVALDKDIDSPTPPVGVDSAAIKITYQRLRVPLAEWALPKVWGGNVNLTNLAGAALIYLFIRSYFADAPDHQHLRGSIPAKDIHTYLLNIRKSLRDELNVLDQLLSFPSPWEEGSEFSQRFGGLHDQFGLDHCIQVAAKFHQRRLEEQAQASIRIAEPGDQ